MNFEGVNTLMRVNIPIRPNGPHSSSYADDTVSKGWIDSRFIFVHKDILVITWSHIRVSEQGLWIDLID